MLKLTNIFKINVANHGYQLFPLSSLDQAVARNIERILPSTHYYTSYDALAVTSEKTIPILPCTSFSFSWLSSMQDEISLLGSIGSHWYHLVDDGGRPGLSFWHAFVARTTDAHSDRSALAGLLLYLMNYYQDHFQWIGTHLSKIATDPSANVLQLITKLQATAREYHPTVDGLTQELVEQARPHLISRTPPYNLVVSPPLSPLIAIPVLVDLSVAKRIPVAGGYVAPGDLSQFRVLATPIMLKGIETVDFNKIILETKKPIRPNNTDLHWEEDTLLSLNSIVDSIETPEGISENNTSEEHYETEDPVTEKTQAMPPGKNDFCSRLMNFLGISPQGQ